MTSEYGCARALVIGLDAATFDVMTPLLERGLLPNLIKLMENGASGALQSTIPPLSPAAWVSTLTGRNPGAHGVFDFRDLDLKELSGRSEAHVSSTAYAGRTIFDVLSRRGLTVGAFHIPLTYPPWPVNGLMVSGPVTPDLSKAYTYPPDLAERLGPLARHTSPEHLKSFEIDRYFDELAWITRTHFEYGLQLLEEKGPFDLFWFHLHSLDSVQHRFWCYRGDSGPAVGAAGRASYAGAIDELYQMADEGVGQLLATIGRDSTVLILSDHGARGRPPMEVRVNARLRELGFLALHGRRGWKRVLRAARRQAGKLGAPWQSLLGEPPATEICWSATRAHAFQLADPVGGVAINLSGRQPNGRVTPADYGAVRDEIIRQLQAWRDPDTGQPVVQNVWRREELYHGPFVERSPDIVFMVAPAYHQGWGVSGSAIVPAPELQPDGWSGVHAMEGILIVQGPSIRRGALVEGATLVDIGPTLLHSMGQAIPSHMEGRVLLDIFTAECRRKKIEYSADEDLVALEGTRSLSAEENEAMISRLQALGYVE